MPEVLQVPFEAVGVGDLDVAPVEKGVEYTVVAVNEQGTRYGVIMADGRLGWFPCKMVVPLPAAPPQLHTVSITSAPARRSFNMEAVHFALGPDGSLPSDRGEAAPIAGYGFLTPAPLPEAHYTAIAATVNADSGPKHVTMSDITALVDLGAASPPPRHAQPKVYAPAPAHVPATTATVSYNAQQQSYPEEPAGGYGDTEDYEQLLLDQLEDLLQPLQPPPQSQQPPMRPRLDTVPPPSLPPPTPPPGSRAPSYALTTSTATHSRCSSSLDVAMIPLAMSACTNTMRRHRSRQCTLTLLIDDCRTLLILSPM